MNKTSGIYPHKLNKITKNNFITYLMVLVLYIAVQLLLVTGNVSSLMEGLLVPLCIYVMLAISLNLTVGILGELSLGHAGFMCVGAFAGAFFSKCMNGAMPDGVRFITALLIGAVSAGIFGILIGIPVLRLKGDYLAIVTLAFGEIIKNLVNVMYIGRDKNGFHFSMKDFFSLNMDAEGEVIVNGAQGITGTPHDASFTMGVILIFLSLIIILNLIHSRDGRAIMSIRDNRIAAESIGINITKYKLMAFSLSAAIAGVAGVLYAHNLSTLTALPKNFGYNMSIMILVFVVLGGIGNIRGSIISAIVLTLLPELLRGLSDYRMLIYAIVLIVMMLFNWSPKAIEWKERMKEKYFPKKLSKGKEVK
ncbi:amino acid/amide ABC transporter membrane protein 2 (HAAT family) [Kineothrix alysoides]|uniref:Amino acid/amide ABC transporter membrane protein 2 (HAAT family) n=1 Tax=Kineothrix alysoides TaxID=1469948 RepID=A0A4R1QZV0_9FIRM|nr:branched-chain amino acid ABC transporter permease [Kineothrix alysoides]TCL58532.1 amino acid/amide ABC transporter membrane protein 2 (HAAT family) [Kineothrix alysoides]